MIGFWLLVLLLLAFWKTTGVSGMDAMTELGPWWLWFGLALPVGGFAFRTIRVKAPQPGFAAAIAGAGFFAALVSPFPWNIPPFVLAAGVLVLVSLDGPWLRSFGKSLAAIGFLLTVQAPIIALLPSVLARRHEVPGLGIAAANVLAFFGVDAIGSGSGFHIDAAHGVFFYTVRLENLLAASFLVIGVSGVVGLLLSGRRHLGWLLGWVAALAGYAFLRFLVLVAIHLEFGDRWIFIHWGWHLLSLLPMFVLLFWLDRHRKMKMLSTGTVTFQFAKTDHKRLAVAGGVIAVGLAMILLGTLGPDPGTAKPGRIIVDEYHSEWESTAEPLNTRTYGMGTTYTYRTLVDYLGLHYPSVILNEEEITHELLADCDVLVLKTPTLAYSEAEITAIVAWVEAGGGLWMIGDHTNVFGMGTHLNKVGARFGIRFLPDATADLRHGGGQYYTPPTWFAHPTVAHMDPMLFATSDSLSIRGKVRASLVGRNLYLDDPDYSVLNFFGDFEMQPHKPYGLFVQGASLRAGKGRVTVFTDSTLFSDFSVFMPGVHQLAEGSVQWLNRKPMGLTYRVPLAALGAILIVIGLIRMAGTPRGARALIVTAAAWAGIGIGALGHVGVVEAFYPTPAPLEPYPEVAFVMDDVDYRLPTEHETHGYDEDNLHTFFVNMQRIGVVPRVYSSLKEAFGADVILLSERVRPFSATEIAQLHRWVERGGELLMMDWPGGGMDPPPAPDPAFYHADRVRPMQTLARHFNLSFGGMVDAGPAFLAEPLDDFSRVELPPAMEVGGGSALLNTEGHVPLAMSKQVGEGSVVIFGSSRAFSVQNMASPIGVPGDDQLDLYQLQYWLMVDVLGIGERR